MGLRQSKGVVLSYDEAKQEVGPEIEQRLRDAFKRYANSHQLLHRVFFFREVLGDVIPEQIAEEVYKAFGGGTNGVSFKDLFVGLVLLTVSQREQKAKFLFSLFSNDSEYIERNAMYQLLTKIDGQTRTELELLFHTRVRVNCEDFCRFIIDNPRATSFSSWLITKKVQLTDNVETKTFYSTLVGVTHLQEEEITQLEHRFWQLKPASGRIDTNVFRDHIGDLLPVPVKEGLFRAFDDNGDEQIDFKEMTCGVSACCRGPSNERQKFCFKIFDTGGKGYLDRQSLREMMVEYDRAWNMNDVYEYKVGNKMTDYSIDELVSSAFPDETTQLTNHEYLLWITKDEPQKSLSLAFLDLLCQICHVIFGLPPDTRDEEKRVILHWLNREKKNSLLAPERRFYLLSNVWWERWNKYVSYKSDDDLDDEDIADEGRSESSQPGQQWLANLPDQDPNMDRNRSVNALTDHRQPVRAFSSSPFTKSSSMSNLANGSEVRMIGYERTRNGGRDRRKSPGQDCAPKEPGPIDNSSLVTYKNSQSVGRLQTITDEGEIVRQSSTQDFIVLPDKLWECLHRRYGGGPTLPRMAVPNSHGELELELHPIMVRILRHQMVPDRSAANAASSTGKSVMEQRYLAQVGAAFTGSTVHSASSSGNGVVNTPRRKPIHLAFFSKVHTVSQIYNFLSAKLHVPREEMRLWLYMEESRMTLMEDEDMAFGKVAEQVHKGHGMENVVYDGRPPPLNLLLEVRNKDLTWPEEIYHLTRTGQLHSKRTSLVLGVTGLNNLGNTCFLNAAIQCVSNTEALREYFKKGLYLYELNKENPLGMKGHMAWRYGQLLCDMWSGNTCVVAPVRLRLTVSQYASQFSGNSQHDAHEFLAFLLDGLHEDLNRVMVKPYVELKDSDGRDDNIVAKEAWDNHLLRNESIVVDLFHGLLKSQVQCNMCSNVSVRFDPFSVLSLPLPMESSQPVDVIVSRLDDSKLVRYRLLLNHDDRFYTLKVELAQFYKAEGVSPADILLAEVLNSQIRGFPFDGDKVNRLTISSVYAYILPRPKDVSPQTADALSPTSSNHDESATSHPSTPSSQTSAMPRNYSTSSLSAVGENVCAFDCFIAYHRKMERNDVYFLAHMKARPRLFGLPIVVLNNFLTCEDLYQQVWNQVKRLMGPKPNESLDPNHAFDCDDNSNNRYPFQLKIVDKLGMKCPNCEWFELCRGCLIPCDTTAVESLRRTSSSSGARYLAIDWEPTALHLRYQSSREFDFQVHRSVQEAERRLTEPMDLMTCLDHFVQQEELDDSDGYYCNKCQQRQRAKKKLDIWMAPPILIVHLKRFHFVNNRWMKSHKIVNFPRENLDLTKYVVSRRRRTASLCRAGLSFEETDNEHGVEEGEDPLSANGLGAGDVEEDGNHRYRLYGIICHLGALGGGHYVSYAKNPNNRWYRFNDSSTKEVKESEIDVNSAYILFYERENADWSKYMPLVDGCSQIELDLDGDDLDDKKCSIQ